METMVSISTATTRSTTVCPSVNRRTPNTTLKKIKTAATVRIPSAKGFPQMLFERASDGTGGFLGISRLHVEPVNEEVIAIDVDDKRSRRQRNRIRERQPTHWGLELGFDSDDPGLDIDPLRIDVSHHVHVRAHKLHQENSCKKNKMIEARGRDANALPDTSPTSEHVGQNGRNQCTSRKRL